MLVAEKPSPTSDQVRFSNEKMTTWSYLAGGAAVEPHGPELVVPPPHTLVVPPPPQVCGEVQLPQLSRPPQPLEMLPQVLLCAVHVVGVQVVPHTLGVPPPPQVAGETQLPQLSVPPQPSASEPQFLPSAAQ